MGRNHQLQQKEISSTVDHCVGLLDGLLSSLKLSDNCMSPDEAVALLGHDRGAVIDVREAGCEKRFRPLEGKYRIAFNEEDFIGRFMANGFGISGFGQVTHFIFVCAYGLRSQNIASRLEQAGMENVYHLCGGLESLEKTGTPLKKVA